MYSASWQHGPWCVYGLGMDLASLRRATFSFDGVEVLLGIESFVFSALFYRVSLEDGTGTDRCVFLTLNRICRVSLFSCSLSPELRDIA